MQLPENMQTLFTAPARPGRMLPALALLCALALLNGCQREDVQVYTVKKDPPRTDLHDHSQDEATAIPPPRPARPQVSWTLPNGWTEAGAGQMSTASFTIKGDSGAEAQVTITPLAKLGGKDAEIINMWREQVGLEALPKEEAAKQFQPVTVGPDQGNLFQIEGKGRAGEGSYSIVTAMVHRDEASWFYKLAGNTELVAAQKPVFVEFLKSIKLTPAPALASSETATPPAAPKENAASSGKFNWNVPSAWTPTAPGAMQVARFGVPEVSGAKAEVFVSVFPNDTGGTLANVNRWRRQVGLPEATEATLGESVTPMEDAGAGAVFVELKGPKQALLGAVVPRDGSYWFYKLMGDPAAVLPQKDAFRGFAKSKP